MNHEVKQVIVLRTDLNISVGKLCVQACHASCLSMLSVKNSQMLKKWNAEGAKKVVVYVKGKGRLLNLYEKAKSLGIPCSLVRNAGLTELEPGTVTALGLGPWESSIIDKVTGSLPLLKGELRFEDRCR